MFLWSGTLLIISIMVLTSVSLCLLIAFTKPKPFVAKDPMLGYYRSKRNNTFIRVTKVAGDKVYVITENGGYSIPIYILKSSYRMVESDNM